jgi:hypothetical protein
MSKVFQGTLSLGPPPQPVALDAASPSSTFLSSFVLLSALHRNRLGSNRLPNQAPTPIPLLAFSCTLATPFCPPGLSLSSHGVPQCSRSLNWFENCGLQGGATINFRTANFTIAGGGKLSSEERFAMVTSRRVVSVDGAALCPLKVGQAVIRWVVVAHGANLNTARRGPTPTGCPDTFLS